jgi:DnaJ family protein A protein 2
VLTSRYKRPFDKGTLYVKFDVKFPTANWLDLSKISQLETLLPPRTPIATIPAGSQVEEVVLSDVDPAKQKRQQEEDQMEEDEAGQGGGPNVQCAQQ